MSQQCEACGIEIEGVPKRLAGKGSGGGSDVAGATICWGDCFSLLVDDCALLYAKVRERRGTSQIWTSGPIRYFEYLPAKPVDKPPVQPEQPTPEPTAVEPAPTLGEFERRLGEYLAGRLPPGYQAISDVCNSRSSFSNQQFVCFVLNESGKQVAVFYLPNVAEDVRGKFMRERVEDLVRRVNELYIKAQHEARSKPRRFGA